MMYLKRSWPLVLLAIPNILCRQVVLHSDETPQPADPHFKSFTNIIGRLLCTAPDTRGSVLNVLRMLPVEVDGVKGATDAATGSFNLSGFFNGTSVSLEVSYDGHITSTINTTALSTRLQVMDDLHSTWTDTFHLNGTANDTTLDLGTVTIKSVDCEIWSIGTTVLEDYHLALVASPPAGQLRVHRWSGLFVGSPYTYYDYMNLRTDWTTDQRDAFVRSNALFHEFAHTVRHVADGSETHWQCDDFNYAYARHHDGSEIFNAQFAFNEGWAEYWAQARQDFRIPLPVVYDKTYTEWNEYLIADQLLADSVLPGSSDSLMVHILMENPKKIHSLHEFEQKLYARLGRAPPTPTPICPPNFTDDGLTCRRDVKVVPKPSYGRGAGTVPNQCGAGRQLDAGLCYPLCITGYHGVGPVCWGSCPPNYSDDGLTCRRDAKIISADNSHCPWYDKCGLTFAKGCSICPPGYSNDGCTCRIDVDIILKASYGRRVGSVPNQCASGRVYDTGLCYVSCRPGYHGVGPVCWGSCPDGYEDHGATCYLGSIVITNGKGAVCL